MRRTILLLTVLLAATAPLTAQRAGELRVGITPPVLPSRGLYRERPDTLPTHPKNTYWKEVALIFAVPVAVIGYKWSRAMGDDVYPSLYAGLGGGLTVGVLGALIGWQIAKPDKAPESR